MTNKTFYYLTTPVCRKCRKHYDKWLERATWAKAAFFWLPLRHYQCTNCGCKRHHLILGKRWL